AVPPLLVALTALFRPLNRWIEWLLETRAMERITPQRLEEVAWSLGLAKVGATWLIIAAVVGSYWILDRIRINFLPEPPPDDERDRRSLPDQQARHSRPGR